MIELILAAALSIAHHPVTDWVFDGRDNKVTYYNCYSTSLVLTVEKQGYIIGTDVYNVDEMTIWLFSDNSKELLRLKENLNWEQKTTTTKLDII